MEYSIHDKDLTPEMRFKMTRSGGKGGQHVNKVSTRVELIFNIYESEILSEEEKQRITEKLSHRIKKGGYIQISSQKTRSQYKNKQIVQERLYHLLEDALTPEKERKATKPTRTSIRKRTAVKKQIAEKKRLRQKPEL